MAALPNDAGAPGEEELVDLAADLKEKDPLMGVKIRRLIGELYFTGQVADIEVGKVSGERFYRIQYCDGKHYLEERFYLERFTAKQVREFQAVQSQSPEVKFYRALADIGIRAKWGAPPGLGVVSEGHVFEVSEEVEGSNGQWHLKLKNEEGWVITRDPDNLRKKIVKKLKEGLQELHQERREAAGRQSRLAYKEKRLSDGIQKQRAALVKKNPSRFKGRGSIFAFRTALRPQNDARQKCSQERRLLDERVQRLDQLIKAKLKAEKPMIAKRPPAKAKAKGKATKKTIAKKPAASSRAVSK